ncbi:hypothetical protein [Symbioplanes lichenis]|uniref:hypothetical protein n=1 Tax=Symbioplanes lichenis TaxID=1629072 RepID=UPI0027396BAC|nr:hypothetical protein [Actinoplanes lichenis]
MKKVIVGAFTALINVALVGAAAPAHAHPSASRPAAGTTQESAAQESARRTAVTAAHASKIVRELYLVPAGIGDSSCRELSCEWILRATSCSQ